MKVLIQLTSILFIFPCIAFSQFIADTTWAVNGLQNCVSPTDTNSLNFHDACTGVNIYTNKLEPDSTYMVVVSGQAYISSGGAFNGMIVSFSYDDKGTDKNMTLIMTTGDTITYKTISNGNHTYINAFILDPGNTNNNHGNYYIRLQQVHGMASSLDKFEKQKIINNYTLEQNYPNPFNPSTNIKFKILERADVRLEIYNSIGQKIITLFDDSLSPGEYNIEWSSINEKGDNVSSGTYFYKLIVNNSFKSKRMILIK